MMITDHPGCLTILVAAACGAFGLYMLGSAIAGWL
jgi:hypothetical protein